MLASLRAAVWRIPRGRVATYGEVARGAGHEGAARQVVWALHNSTGGLPWHRVVGAGGAIKLPGEAGFEQRMRLQSEGVQFRGARVAMSDHEFRFDRQSKRPRKKL
jgi:methylated-DNA-protein-cysteine methyltransferase related protein